MGTTTKIKARRGVWSRVKRNLFAGVLVTAPAFITLYTVIGGLNIADRWVKSMLPARFYPDSRFFGIPGIGLVLMLAMLVGIGFLATNWLGNFFVNITDRIFVRTPVLSTLYSTLKQLFQTFLGENTHSFRQVVFVEFPRSGIWSIGFVTGPCGGETEPLDEDMVYVFVPTTPNPTNGYLVMISRNRIKESSLTVEQGLKAVVSMGITK